MVGTILQFSGWFIGAFVGMELLSYAMHRWLFHGVLWNVHVTHHEKRHGTFELNDAFSAFFTVLAIFLLILGLRDPLGSFSFPVGLGMTAYGMLYFFVHDLVTHRRFMPMVTKSRWIERVRRAHLHHHQRIDKPGQEPFGLFLFPYRRFGVPSAKSNRPEDRVTVERP